MPAPLAGPDRFAAVAAAVADPVRRYLWRRTDEATADDVLAATLSVLWRRPDDIPDDPVPWAIGVARLQLQNARRSQRRQVLLAQRIAVVDPPQVRVDAEQGPSESDETVRLVLARLRESDAELLRLWAWEELDSRAIAEVLGITANAASIRLHRARRRFAELFQETKGESR